MWHLDPLRLAVDPAQLHPQTHAAHAYSAYLEERSLRREEYPTLEGLLLPTLW